MSFLLPHVPEHVVYREVDGALVLTSLKAGGFLRLDDIGREVWTAVASGTDIEVLIGRLREMYDVPADVCRADVVAFLDDLHKRGLIVLDGAPQ